jgi:hypothetical protein
VSPVWTSLTAANTPNIYSTDGTLAGNRVVTQGANNLTFSSTSGNFIYNPTTSGRMGVGTSSPQAKLHINSELAATNTINADASVLRLSRPTTVNVNWDNIAQFNLGSYAAATPNAETRLDLGLNNLENADSTFTKVMTWQANGNVGVGTTAPTSKLEVNGAATNTVALNAAAATSIDFSASNIAITSATATAITLNNLKNGGAYTLIFTSTAATGTVAFSASGFTFVYVGTEARTSGKKHIYSLIVAGTEVYVTMGTQN